VGGSCWADDIRNGVIHMLTISTKEKRSKKEKAATATP
jgi:hypothetical protein